MTLGIQCCKGSAGKNRLNSRCIVDLTLAIGFLPGWTYISLDSRGKGRKLGVETLRGTSSIRWRESTSMWRNPVGWPDESWQGRRGCQLNRKILERGKEWRVRLPHLFKKTVRNAGRVIQGQVGLGTPMRT